MFRIRKKEGEDMYIYIRTFKWIYLTHLIREIY